MFDLEKEAKQYEYLFNKQGYFNDVNGNRINPLMPTTITSLSKNEIIKSIVFGLSNKCRFNGQIPFLWTVAQHSMLVEDFVKTSHKLKPLKHLKRYRILALLHDCEEAFLPDIPSSLKPFIYVKLSDGRISPIADIGRKLRLAIYERLGVICDKDTWSEVKKRDKLALNYEFNFLFERFYEVHAIRPRIRFQDQVEIRKEFVDRLKELHY